MDQARDLQELFNQVPVKNPIPDHRIQITGIKIDSREIAPGDLFVVIRGTKLDGHQYISDAVDRGAAAVVGSESADKHSDLGIPYLEVDETRATLAQLAAAWYGLPARQLVVIGVTGTDGKTTTANLIYQILITAGIKTGMITTVNAVIGDQILDTGFHVTTPEAVDIQGYLAEMVKAGITHVVLETTSHGLAQKRVATCEYDIGLVTNITHEHLDYHGDYQEYLSAKAMIFDLVASSSSKPRQVSKIAVINADDGSYPELKYRIKDLGLTRVDYGEGGKVEYRADKIRSHPGGLSFELLHEDQVIKIHTSLMGRYNISNCLAAAAVARSGLGITWKEIQNGIASLEKIPGRMEGIDLGQDFLVVVDFAHTPNALHQALRSARELTNGKVIAVFGSAGLRDQEKRRLMAETSIEIADLTILTAEDPRTESLDDILEEMAQGATSKGGKEEETFWRVPDRGNAIRQGLQLATTDDLVIICGKGHEQSMCFEETEYPWDDRTATRAALAEMLGIDGPEMPYLPTSNQF